MIRANLSYINKLAGTDENFRNKLIEVLKTELPLEVEVFSRQFREGNLILASQSVHKLKHKIHILGLEKSYYIAHSFEENLMKNSTELFSEFEAIVKTMSEFVENL